MLETLGWLLLGSIIVVVGVLLACNTYLLVKWAHPDDSNQYYGPKLAVLLALTLTEARARAAPPRRGARARRARRRRIRARARNLARSALRALRSLSGNARAAAATVLTPRPPPPASSRGARRAPIVMRGVPIDGG